MNLKTNNYYLGKPIECKPIDNTETKDSIKKSNEFSAITIEHD